MSVDPVVAGIIASGAVPESVRRPWFQSDLGDVSVFTVPGAQAIPVWEALRKHVAESGLWPVVIGTDEELARHDDMRDGQDPVRTRDVLADAGQLDVRVWLETRRQEEAECGDAEGVELPPHGPWPRRAERNDMYTVPRDILTMRHHPLVHMALVPTTRSHEVPAIIPLGNWNDCPPPDVHVAMLRHWCNTYGAELVCMSPDVIELAVSRWPSDQVGAMSLAVEQYWYCRDIVEQGVGTIEALAAGLMRSPVWYFWWD